MLQGSNSGTDVRAPSLPRIRNPFRRPPLRLRLALQGGGAHGAFTWGVLDRLLEEPGIEITAVSGTSAGAVNAVALAWGWCQDGPEGARALLERLWRSIGDKARRAPVGMGGLGAFAIDLATHLFSPYQLNPLGIDPLGDLLRELIDFPQLRQASPMDLLIAATHVRTGRCRIFRERELTPQMLLASTCLPQIHHAVDVGGELYWDGGFSSNPPVLALAELGGSEPLLLVRIAPAEVREPPRRARHIRQRTAELVFGRPLADELAFLAQLQAMASNSLTRLMPRLHGLVALDLQVIDADEVVSSLDPTTKLLPEMRLLERLRVAGRAAAAQWLADRRGARS